MRARAQRRLGIGTPAARNSEGMPPEKGVSAQTSIE